MNPVVLAVARWEILRFVKVKDLVTGTITVTIAFAAFGFVGDLVKRQTSKARQVAVIGGDLMGLDQITELDRFTLVHSQSSAEDLDEAVRAEEFDALLVVTGPEQADLRATGTSGWHDEFLARLAAFRQVARVQEADLEPAMQSALLSPPQLTRADLSRPQTQRAGITTALLVVGAMLMGLFLGFSYVFVAITAEKTQHVTESVLAAITPQQWIDGKIIGLTVVVIVQLTSTALGYVIYKLIARLAFNRPFDLPSGTGDPLTVALLILFAVLGFGFWLTLFALVAATISDPNTSNRSSLLFLPFLPMGLTFLGLDHPEAWWLRVMSIFPGISQAGMPMRLLRGDPEWWEILLSLMLLAVSAWMFRRMTGKIFGVSMLMTGKEPSWREVWRWIREPA